MGQKQASPVPCHLPQEGNQLQQEELELGSASLGGCPHPSWLRSRPQHLQGPSGSGRRTAAHPSASSLQMPVSDPSVTLSGMTCVF